MANSSVVVNFQAGGIARVQQAFRGIEQTVARAEKAAAKESQKASTQRIKIATTEEKKREQEFAKLAKSAAKWEQQGVKETEKAEKAKSAIAQRGAKYRDTVQQNSARLAARYVDQQIRQEEASAKKIQATRARISRSIGGSVGGTLGRLTNTATMMGGAALALGGGFGIADAVNKQLSLEKQSALVSNASGGTYSTAQVMGNSKTIGLKTNQDPSKVADAMKAYVDASGDVEGAMKNAELFSKIGTATGADLNEIGATAGMLKVQNPDLDDKKMKEMLLGIIGQGKAGSVDFKELAGIASVATSTSSMYSGDQGDNQRKLLGLTQIARRTSGSADEAATTVSRFGSDTLKHQADLEAAGISVKGKDGNLKDPTEIMRQVFDKTKGDMGKIMGLGFGERSIRMFQAEKGNYDKGGTKAVVADMQRFQNMGMSEKDLDKDFGNVMNTSSAKFEQATLRVTSMIQEKLTPYLERFADKLSDPAFIAGIEKLFDGIGRIADYFLDNPFKSIGAVVGLAITKDLATGVVSKALADSISKSSNASGGLAIVAAAATITVAGMAMIDKNNEATHDNIVQGGADINAATALIAKAKGGPVDAEEAKKLIASLSVDTKKTQDDVQTNENMKKASLGLLSGTANPAIANDNKRIDDLNLAIKKLTDAMNVAKPPASNASSPANPNNSHPIASIPRGGPTG